MSKDKYENSTLDGRYHLQRLLDSGSFGAVYEARDTKLGRIVAVKILFEKDETAFRKEAKLAVQFDHPNVVKVYDYGADGNLGVGYIVMEFLKGCRLDQLTTRHLGRVPETVIVRFVDQIGAALQMAHEKNLIHRDLKPQNVMLVEEGSLQERFVLLDLGLASQMNATSTLRNQTLDGALSPRYASPEQMGQETVDYRSDIYSFGTILYELFTGEVPFVRDQLLSLMMAICSEAPPPFKFAAPNREVPSEVEEIIQHCLAKKPNLRPESIRIVRSRILAAFGADTAMPGLNTSNTKRTAGRSTSAAPLMTGTMQPPSLDGSDDVPAVSSESLSHAELFAGRGRKSGQRSGSWRRVAISLLLLLPVLFVTVPKLFQLRVPTPTPPPLTGEVHHAARMIVYNDELRIEAGGAGFMKVYVEPPDDVAVDGETLTLSASDVPAWLKVQIPTTLSTSTMIDLSVNADDSLEDKSGEFMLHVSLGSWNDNHKIRVIVVPPEPWALPNGFEPMAGAPVVRAGTDGRVFHSRITRVIDSDLTVNFILIYPPETSTAASKDFRPFYIMENKVWNALFARYWSAAGQADPYSSVKAEWQRGAIAGSTNLDAASNPQLPVVSVKAYNAHQFAVWIGGKDRCHLPSFEQWEMASGFYDWQGMTSDERAASPWPEGPYRGQWSHGETNVCVNRRQDGPQPVGKSSDDVSSTGCRDMAGNVEELTESMIFGKRIGEVPPGSEGGQLQVMTRGHSYISARPLSWNDLQGEGGGSIATEYDNTDPTIGFRVVLETTR